jgi:hypothetical protein
MSNDGARPITIHRAKPKTAFAMVPNAIAQNEALSLGARGLLVYLLSLPVTWEIRMDHLMSHAKVGTHALRAMMRELARAGHVHRFAILGGAPGQFVGSRWHVFADPAELAALLADPDRPCGFLTVGKPADVQKGRIGEKDTEKKDQKDKTARPGVGPVGLNESDFKLSPAPAKARSAPRPPPVPTEAEARAYAKAHRISSPAVTKFWRLNEAASWRTKDIAGRMKPIRDWRKALDAFAEGDAKLPTYIPYPGTNDEFHAWMKANLTEEQRQYVGPWIERSKRDGWKIKNKTTGLMEPVRDWHAACKTFCERCDADGIYPWTMAGGE